MIWGALALGSMVAAFARRQQRAALAARGAAPAPALFGEAVPPLGAAVPVRFVPPTPPAPPHAGPVRFVPPSALPIAAEPESPPGPPPAPKTASIPVSGRAFVRDLPEPPTWERENAILQMVLAGMIRPFRWVAVDCSSRAHHCVVYVSDDAIAVGHAADGVRVNVRHPTAQRIADAYEAVLPTTRISDQAYRQADVRLRHHPQTPDVKMAHTSRMLRHHEAVEAERAGRRGLVRTVGKEWVNTNLLFGRPGRAALFGWHSPTGAYRSPGGARVVQPLSVEAHDVGHVDYSHTVCLVSRRCVVDGVARDLESVLRSPQLAHLVSDEGPMRVTRHPAVARKESHA